MRRCATTMEAEMTALEHTFLHEQLHQRQLRGRHLEIGTAAGGTLVSMIQSYGERVPEFVVVDRMRYFPDQRKTIDSNLKKHHVDPNVIDFRTTTSFKAFADAKRHRERFDFILIDASHKIVSVTADLRWTQLLNPGGLVCLHDYCDRFPGVVRPVDRFLRRNKNYQFVGQGGSLIAIRKLQGRDHAEVGLSDFVSALAWHVPLEIDRRRRKYGHRKPTTGQESSEPQPASASL